MSILQSFASISSIDYAASTHFYTELFKGTEYSIQPLFNNMLFAIMHNKTKTPLLYVSSFTNNQEPPERGNGNQINIVVSDKEDVRLLHNRAISLGGQDEGPPENPERASSVHYRAYFRDLSGYKFCVIVSM